MYQKSTRKEKDAIIIILKSLIPYRDQAEWFLEIIQNTNNEELENKLINIIYQKVKTIKSNKEIESIKKNILLIHNKYEYIEEKDKEDAERFLDDFIDNIW
jgi:hypothetical protein